MKLNLCDQCLKEERLTLATRKARFFRQRITLHFCDQHAKLSHADLTDMINMATYCAAIDAAVLNIRNKGE